MQLDLRFPTIHLNGTSAKELSEQLEKAYTAITAAQEALAQAAPNARDYYPQPTYPASFEEARAQHFSRMERLTSVKKEIEIIAEYIADEALKRGMKI